MAPRTATGAHAAATPGFVKISFIRLEIKGRGVLNMSIHTIIQAIEAEQIKKDIPAFAPGDLVIVQVEVKEGTRTRLQAFEGVVIAKRNRGLNSAFTVRKISHGEGVERVFQTHSKAIKGIEVKRRGHVRKAKLYYLRDLAGKSARIREKLVTKDKVLSTAAVTGTSEPQANTAAE